MIGLLTGLGARAWGYLAAAGGIVLGLLVMFGKARQSGKDAVRLEAAGERDKNREKRDAVDRDVQRAGDAAVDKRLRDKWSRD